MSTITFRLSESEKAAIEASARLAGQTVSDYIRETIALREQQGVDARLERVEEQLARLESLARLD